MPDLQVHGLQLGAIGTNCYIAHIAGETDAFIVDPGDDADSIVAVIDELGLTPVGVLVTHCHWDHIGAVAPIASRYSIPVWMSSIEAPVLEENINDFVPAGVGPFETHPVDHRLDGGETFELAGIPIRTIHLPGHSPGTIGYLVDGEPPMLFIGDLIFAGSVGRVDLPFADAEQLVASIKHLLDTLDDETVLLSGHGQPTTLGQERSSNPFVGPIAAGENILR